MAGAVREAGFAAREAASRPSWGSNCFVIWLAKRLVTALAIVCSICSLIEENISAIFAVITFMMKSLSSCDI